MRTNLPGVYAAGDCIITDDRQLGATWLPLGTTIGRTNEAIGRPI